MLTRPSATANTFTSSFWACLETFYDPSLLSRARAEAVSALHASPTASTTFDHDKLLRQPLLQSIYSETLRLRVVVYIYRCKAQEVVKIGKWNVPPRTHIVTLTSTAHYDRDAWNEGPNGEHPVTEFWADRFLTYPNDPTSGPRKKDPVTSEGRPHKPSGDPSSSQPVFDMQGMAANGHWIPYGGRPRGCFGRHLARREILLILASMVLMFDVEFLGKGKVGPSEDDYGAGAQRADGKVPFRIRRRNTGAVPDVRT